MSSKNALKITQITLDRASGTLSILSGMPWEILLSARMEIETYQDTMAGLETNAKALEGHLLAISALLPIVQKQTRNLKKQNKHGSTVLKKVLHGKNIVVPSAHKSNPILLASIEAEPVVSAAPNKAKLRKTPGKK